MKTPKAPTEKPTSKTKTEQAATAVVAEAKATKPAPATQKSPKKPKAALASKPEPKAKVEQPVVAVVEKLKAEKPNEAAKAPKKTNAAASKPVAVTADMPVPERVGLTAGSIWHFLDKNGATSVVKLIGELPEEEKIIQRSIGWLAQEGKISLELVAKVETISLKA